MRWFPFPTRESLRWTGPEANFLRWALRDADAQGAEGLFEHLTSDFILWFSIRSQKTVVYSCMKIWLYNIYNVCIILEYLGNQMAPTDLGGFPCRMAEASGCEWWWNHRCEQPQRVLVLPPWEGQVNFLRGWWMVISRNWVSRDEPHTYPEIFGKCWENGSNIYIYVYVYVYVRMSIYIYISNMGFVVCKRHESWGYG